MRFSALASRRAGCTPVLLLVLMGLQPVAAQSMVNVSTLAGGSGGFSDGRGTSARFNGPDSIASDAVGTIALVVSSKLHIECRCSLPDMFFFVCVNDRWINLIT
jgi:hypothetical protein